MDLVAVLAGLAGGVLVWCSIKNKHPIQAVQLALSGGDPNAAGPFTAASESPAGATAKGGASTPGPDIIPPDQPPIPWGTI